MKDKIVPIASLGVGLVAFVLTLQFWRVKENELQAEWQRLHSAQRRVGVIVVRRAIPRGTTLVAEDLTETQKYPSEIMADAMDAYDARDVLTLRKKTTRTLNPGDQLTWSAIEGGRSEVVGLAPIIRHNMRAISISVGGAAAVSGMVRPNDRVDVLGTFSFPAQNKPGEMETATLTLLQDVLVLGTGQTLARDRQDPRRRDTSYSTVTIEVTPREAELLVFAQQTQGRLSLSLRHPADVGYEPAMPAVNFDHLQNNIETYNRLRQEFLRKPLLRKRQP